MSVKTTDTLVQRIGDRFKQALQESSDFRGDLSVVVEPAVVVDLARYLKADEGFDYLLYATAVDWPARDPRFTVVWKCARWLTKPASGSRLPPPCLIHMSPASRRSGPPRTGTNARPGTCWASGSIATLTCAASSCLRPGRGFRCARTTSRLASR